MVRIVYVTGYQNICQMLFFKTGHLKRNLAVFIGLAFINLWGNALEHISILEKNLKLQECKFQMSNRNFDPSIEIFVNDPYTVPVHIKY